MASSSCPKQSTVAMNHNTQTYPSPLARYEDVVASQKLFMATLEKLHSMMGTKFMIPIIGGKELDLHKLFVEVTSRGGIEKIIRERRWKEVTATFSFPPTATNASFVLRKYYFSLLHNYEQIYFFKARGQIPPDSTRSVSMHGTVKPSLELQAITFSQPRNDSGENPAASSTGSPVIGVIDGKFESGYLVTVTIGSEKLRGVLYQIPKNTGPPSYGVFPTSWTDKANYQTPSGTKRRRRRKKSEIKRRDPAHPKPNRSGYNFFFAEQHARLKPLHPGKDREISRMIGELWNKLNEQEKSVYQGKALEDKERYRAEMEDYREKLRTGQLISNAVPLQQRLPGQDLEMAEADATMEEAEAEEEEGEEEGDSSGCSGESEQEEDQNCASDAEVEEGSHPGPKPPAADSAAAPREKAEHLVEPFPAAKAEEPLPGEKQS
ncbi:PREDICTED: high mobility group B protein 15 [Tarenaya hassleriana]|uniref:high mobility group B protein 15 n=1 Tax=Tarenaya hassleriana TaxID=28532 RepID=UPI00053C9F4C|nr:PREDICTED: high mobility group B protein 15 [Tarenaya hassleriana]XP_010522407.1 PREDICTED: high mobility group B protein 15 [Tarenaya hassleriana]